MKPPKLSSANLHFCFFPHRNSFYASAENDIITGVTVDI